jgi:hypothetical protein
MAHDEMQTYWDERSDDWQESQKGEDFQQTIDQLEEILTTLQEFGSELH